jgi:hypothetical protein
MDLSDFQKKVSSGGHSMDDRPCPSCGDLDGCHLPGRLRDDKLTFEQFWDALAVWSQATFRTDQEQGPQGPLKHLAKEVKEALAECEKCVEFASKTYSFVPGQFPGSPELLKECADTLFLVFDITRRAGFTFDQLRVAVNQKLKINMQRRWDKPTSDEPVEHIRDEDTGYAGGE